jgi:UDP-GlcNAc:undecaprenyl-phosphate GlcNAc-1-phosphate transferase
MEGLFLEGLTLKHLYLFLTAGLICAGVTYVTRHIASRLNIFAKRDLRRRHEHDTPLLGGTGFYLVLMSLTLLTWLFPEWMGFDHAVMTTRHALCFLAALTLIYGVGALDDWKELKALPKFVVQFIAASLILYSEPHPGLLIDGEPIPDWIVTPCLLIWVIGITNALNMIDGLDGLCAGVAGLTALSMAMIMLGIHQHVSFSFILSVAVAGSCLGFLYFNFNPAKIFLGDSGSTLLGFVLAVISIKLELKRSLLVSLSLPLILLGLPVIDVGLSIIRRNMQSRSMFRGDRSHLHHRLQQIGLTHRSAVFFLWSAAAYLNLMAYSFTRVPTPHSYYIYASVIPTVGFWMLALFFMERRLTHLSAQYSRVFMRDEGSVEFDRSRLDEFFSEKVKQYHENKSPFVVIIISMYEVLKQISREKPSEVIGYYTKLYNIFKERLRGSDFLARLSDQQIVAILPGVDGKKSSPSYAVINDLSDKVKNLQEAYHVFQPHASHPEGFTVFTYPKDRAKIESLLGIQKKSELEGNPRKNAA